MEGEDGTSGYSQVQWHVANAVVGVMLSAGRLASAEWDSLARPDRIAAINAQSDEEMFSAAHVAGELLVQFRPSGIVSERCAQTGRTTFVARSFCTGELLRRFHPGGFEGEAQEVRGVIEACGLTVKHTYPLLTARDPAAELNRIGMLAAVQVPASLALAEARARLLARPEVEYVQPNHTFEPFAVPNDPDFDLLWYFENTQQDVPGCLIYTPGTLGEDIDGPNAWDFATGTPEVRLAVIEYGGFWMDHPDLSGIFGDGYDYANDDPDPNNPDGQHGTLVVGMMAAKGNNATGVTGACWDCTVLPYQVGASQVNTGTILLAFKDMIAQEAVAVNMSWGHTSYNEPLRTHMLELLENGIIVVAAAGNTSTRIDPPNQVYPAAHDLENIIAVASSTSTGELAAHSNWGATSVDICAPGEGLWTTISELNGGEIYTCSDGTSLAAPLVAGTIGVLYSYRPDADWRAVRNAILCSADVLPGLADCKGLGVPCVATQGRLNAAAAFSWLERGDNDLDGDVDLLDWASLQFCFGESDAACTCIFDLDFDGAIGLADHALWATSLFTGPE